MNEGISDALRRAKEAIARGPIAQLELTEEDKAGEDMTVASRMRLSRMVAFLRAFARRGIILDGVDAAQVTRSTVANWREEDEWFEALFQEALEEAADGLEREAYRRAVDGVDEPVIFHGMPTMVEDADSGQQRVLTVKVYSDQLLTLLLKGHKPEKFRENVKTTHGFEGQTGVLVVPAAVTPEAWAKAAEDQQAKFAGSTPGEPGAQ